MNRIVSATESAIETLHDNQPVRMHPHHRIPIELHEQVIKHLSPGDQWPDADTLAKCALTCRYWYHIANKGLYNQIEVLGKERYKKLLDTVTARTKHHASEIPEIRTMSIHDATPGEGILHAALHTLPCLLHQLEHLCIFGPHGTKNPIFHPHPSIFATLSQFSTVHSISIHSIEFNSLAELRKILASLPSLNLAVFRRVMWKKADEMPFKPLFNATSWRLSNFSLTNCSSNHIAPFFWAQPLQSSFRLSQSQQNIGSHPLICATDVEPLVQLVQCVLSLSEEIVGSVCWEWKQKTDHSVTWYLECCIDTITYDQNSTYIQIFFSKAPETTLYQLITSIKIWINKPEDLALDHLDTLLDQFQDLQHLYLNFMQLDSDYDLKMVIQQLSIMIDSNVQLYIQGFLYDPDYSSINSFLYFLSRSSNIKQENTFQQYNCCSQTKEWITSQRTYLLYSLNRLSQWLYKIGFLEQNRELRKQIIEIQRELNKLNPAIYSKLFLDTLRDLGSELCNLKHYKEALKYNREAVEIGKTLASQDPATFRPILSESFSNMGNNLYNLGMYKEAFDNDQNVVKILSTLAQHSPKIFKPLLAESLHNIAADLLNIQYSSYKEALWYNKEGLEIVHVLRKQDSKTYSSVLVKSLTRVGDNYHNLGCFEKALQCDQEAVKISRALASQNSKDFNLLLAQSLNNTGVDLYNLGLYQKSLRCHQEAAEISRILGCDLECLLAESLTNAGANYRNLGFYKEALECDQEVMEIRCTIASRDPGVKSVANHLHSFRRVERGLLNDQEALETDCTFDTLNQNMQILSLLVNSLSSAGTIGRRLGCIGITLRYNQEVVEISQLLANRNPERFVPLLVDSLQVAEASFRELGYDEEADELNEEAIKIKRVRISPDPQFSPSCGSPEIHPPPLPTCFVVQKCIIILSVRYSSTFTVSTSSRREWSKGSRKCMKYAQPPQWICQCYLQARLSDFSFPQQPAFHPSPKRPKFRANFKIAPHLYSKDFSIPIHPSLLLKSSQLHSTYHLNTFHIRESGSLDELHKVFGGSARLDSATMGTKEQHRCSTTARRHKPRLGFHPPCGLKSRREHADHILGHHKEMPPSSGRGFQPTTVSRICKIVSSSVVAIIDHVSGVIWYLEPLIHDLPSLDNIGDVHSGFLSHHTTSLRETQKSDVNLGHGHVLCVGTSWLEFPLNHCYRPLYVARFTKGADVNISSTRRDPEVIAQQPPKTVKSKVGDHIDCGTISPDPVSIAQQTERMHCVRIQDRLASRRSILPPCLIRPSKHHRINSLREQVMEQTLKVQRELLRADALRLESDLADSLHNVGLDFYELRRYQDAFRCHKEAAEIRRRLVKKRPELFRPALAESLFNTGLSLQKLRRYEEAIKFYDEVAGMPS